MAGPNCKEIRTSTDMIAHRGPDDQGIFANEGIAFGHRRLSIIDLSPNGHQPMETKDGRFVIVFNGEIYNHNDLRRELLSDVEFKGHSDTETILYGYARYGEKFIVKLNGIFAFSILDKHTGEVIVARDHFGVKPLYYYSKGLDFYFASEIKSFLNVTFDKSLDIKSISNYIYFLYSPGENTPFKYVKKLAPGHFLKFNLKNSSVKNITKYYEVPFQGTYFDKWNEKQHIAHLDCLLTQAVERQMLSDVPVGFFLSGGLDSSAIVAMARKLFPQKRLECYTIDTGGRFDGFSDDLQYAKKCASYLGVNLNIIKADFDIVRDFDKMIWHLDEPQADAAPLNVLNICRQARKNGHIVLLGGTAGDDLFSGYRRHQAVLAEKLLFQSMPAGVWKAAFRLTGQFSSSSSAIRRLKKLLVDAGKAPLERMAGYYGWIDEITAKGLFTDKYANELNDHNFSAIFLSALGNIKEERELLNKMLFWDIKYFLTDHNLNYTDKMGMAEGVEIRVPFLDTELVDYSTKIPVGLKMKGKETKYLLKKTMEKYLPREIIYRPKTGFGAPVRKWINQDLSPMITERLSKSNLDRWGFFNYDAVQTLIAKNASGKIDASYSIWAVLAIQSWLNQFYENGKQG